MLRFAGTIERGIVAILCGVTLSACAVDTEPVKASGGPTYPTQTWSQPPNNDANSTFAGSMVCGLPQSDEAELAELGDAAGSCLHELVACGQTQTRLAQSLLVAVFLSNQAAFGFEDATVAQLKELAKGLGLMIDASSLSHDGGRWHVSVPGPLSSMDFWVSFHDPLLQPAGKGQVGALILANPFELDAYLVGAKVTTSLSFKEMRGSMEAKNHYEFSYEALGPLGHILAGPDGTVPNPIAFDASLWDFAEVAMGTAKPGVFGPFGNLTDLVMTAEGSVERDYGAAHLQMDIRGPATPLATLVASSFGFDIQALRGSTAHWDMDSHRGSLAYLWQGELAGSMAHELRRRDRSISGRVDLISDFGSGASYPEPQWTCPKAQRD